MQRELFVLDAAMHYANVRSKRMLKDRFAAQQLRKNLYAAEKLKIAHEKSTTSFTLGNGVHLASETVRQRVYRPARKNPNGDTRNNPPVARPLLACKTKQIHEMQGDGAVNKSLPEVPFATQIEHASFCSQMPRCVSFSVAENALEAPHYYLESLPVTHYGTEGVEPRFMYYQVTPHSDLETLHRQGVAQAVFFDMLDTTLTWRPQIPTHPKNWLLSDVAMGRFIPGIMAERFTIIAHLLSVLTYRPSAYAPAPLFNFGGQIVGEVRGA